MSTCLLRAPPATRAIGRADAVRGDAGGVRALLVCRRLDAGELPLGLVRGVIEAIRQRCRSARRKHPSNIASAGARLARAGGAEARRPSSAPRGTGTGARYQAWPKDASAASAKWTQGIHGLRWRGFDVQPIRDSAMLSFDGERMRTCLTTYADECANGRYVVFAVRTPGRPRPWRISASTSTKNGTGYLDQVRGFADRGVAAGPRDSASAWHGCRMRMPPAPAALPTLFRRGIHARCLFAQ